MIWFSKKKGFVVSSVLLVIGGVTILGSIGAGVYVYLSPGEEKTSTEKQTKPEVNLDKGNIKESETNNKTADEQKTIKKIKLTKIPEPPFEIADENLANLVSELKYGTDYTCELIDDDKCTAVCVRDLLGRKSIFSYNKLNEIIEKSIDAAETCAEASIATKIPLTSIEVKTPLISTEVKTPTTTTPDAKITSISIGTTVNNPNIPNSLVPNSLVPDNRTGERTNNLNKTKEEKQSTISQVNSNKLQSKPTKTNTRLIFINRGIIATPTKTKPPEKENGKSGLVNLNNKVGVGEEKGPRKILESEKIEYVGNGINVNFSESNGPPACIADIIGALVTILFTPAVGTLTPEILITCIFDAIAIAKGDKSLGKNISRFLNLVAGPDGDIDPKFISNPIEFFKSKVSNEIDKIIDEGIGDYVCSFDFNLDDRDIKRLVHKDIDFKIGCEGDEFIAGFEINGDLTDLSNAEIFRNAGIEGKVITNVRGGVENILDSVKQIQIVLGKKLEIAARQGSIGSVTEKEVSESDYTNVTGPGEETNPGSLEKPSGGAGSSPVTSYQGKTITVPPSVVSSQISTQLSLPSLKQILADKKVEAGINSLVSTFINNTIVDIWEKGLGVSKPTKRFIEETEILDPTRPNPIYSTWSRPLTGGNKVGRNESTGGIEAEGNKVGRNESTGSIEAEGNEEGVGETAFIDTLYSLFLIDDMIVFLNHIQKGIIEKPIDKASERNSVNCYHSITEVQGDVLREIVDEYGDWGLTFPANTSKIQNILNRNSFVDACGNTIDISDGRYVHPIDTYTGKSNVEDGNADETNGEETVLKASHADLYRISLALPGLETLEKLYTNTLEVHLVLEGKNDEIETRTESRFPENKVNRQRDNLLVGDKIDSFDFLSKHVALQKKIEELLKNSPMPAYISDENTDSLSLFSNCEINSKTQTVGGIEYLPNLIIPVKQPTNRSGISEIINETYSTIVCEDRNNSYLLTIRHLNDAYKTSFGDPLLKGTILNNSKNVAYLVSYLYVLKDTEAIELRVSKDEGGEDFESNFILGEKITGPLTYDETTYDTLSTSEATISYIQNVEKRFISKYQTDKIRKITSRIK